MNSLVRVFSNFKVFYNDINAATLTGAIDVIVVEQPDGEFQCSPFHVRFGKLGVLRSREKVVDIEINGVPADIRMKLGDSGEAFFVEEYADENDDELPANMATSPIPSYLGTDKPTSSSTIDSNVNAVNFVAATEEAKIASKELQIPLPLPRRNSIDFSKQASKETDAKGNKFQNQVSDYSQRRHTDNTLERRNLSEKLKEYTTQKIREEWAVHEENFNVIEKDKTRDWNNSPIQNRTTTKSPSVSCKGTKQNNAIDVVLTTAAASSTISMIEVVSTEQKPIEKLASDSVIRQSVKETTNLSVNKDECKVSKTKKRRKKSLMKKKNAQRKTSSGSSMGSNIATEINGSGSSVPLTDNVSRNGIDEIDILSATLSTTATNYLSNNEYMAKSYELTKTTAALVTTNAGDESPISETANTLAHTPSQNRMNDLDIHFFSDTEITTTIGAGAGSVGRGAGRPSTPVQSDSELETTMRDKHHDGDGDDNTASWKWGELPTPEQTKLGDTDSPEASQHAERKSMLSNMFSFMKKANKIRKEANEAGDIYLSELDTSTMDPKLSALYFPDQMQKSKITTGGATYSANSNDNGEDDPESGNGTSLPHSFSSMEEGQKSIDSDYEDGKQPEMKYLDFIAMSECGFDKKGEPNVRHFDKHLITYPEVCKKPSLFLSPNLIVRLNGKYYTWAAACPIVMTIIIFQKPLTDEAIDELMSKTRAIDTKQLTQVEVVDDNNMLPTENTGQVKRSWWYWRRSQENTINPDDAKITRKDDKLDEKDGEQTAVGTQTSRPNTPDESEQQTLSKTDISTINAENTSLLVDNLKDLSMSSNKSDEPKERYKKSLRLSSAAIKKLDLNEGMNLIEFSVTTAYQGTTRCKCYLFRWKHTDKVVISDIDGTITKSDVLGHILPMMGKDWAQMGVAQLFSKIEQNGYKLLYLSARAIGQSRVTREYLRSIRQGDVVMPNGPLLLNPTSLISAFHREVIEKKPEQFKIACLSDIRDLFPSKDPFYAGYGNRINDVWAYRAVGIPIERIFTINTKGELKHELTQTFQSSYCSMTYIVDQLFPPIKHDQTAVEYSNFNYWRDPIPDLDDEVEKALKANRNKPENNLSCIKAMRPIPEK